MALYVGTSGWAYPEWKPGFYPADLPRSRFLEHYAQTLRACEINATFYRLQSADTTTKWGAAAPGGFRFTMKAHRRLTHARSMALDDDRKDLLDAFLRSLQPLGERLGAVLFQYPPTRSRDVEGLNVVLDAIAGRIPVAFEFRHPSWEDPEVARLLAERGVTRCISETEGKVPDGLPEGPIAYVRLRSDRYGAPERTAWRDLLARESATRDVFAFAKHEGIPADDPFGGVGLARWLVENP